MGTRAVERGPTSERVARNIRALREEQRLSLDDLMARLSKLGRPILASGISKLETGSRRVDVDDLVALAIALDVSPNRLLLPATADEGEQVDLTPARSAGAEEAWRWACGEAALGATGWLRDASARQQSDRLREFRDRNRPHDPPPSLEFLGPYLGEVTGLYKAMLAAQDAGLTSQQIGYLARWRDHREAQVPPSEAVSRESLRDSWRAWGVEEGWIDDGER